MGQYYMQISSYIQNTKNKTNFKLKKSIMFKQIMAKMSTENDILACFAAEIEYDMI